MKLDDLKARLRSSAKAFRENTVYDSEGDPLPRTGSGVRTMDMVERVALYDLSALKEVVG